ncbi:MAG: LysR family transcriptional regulator [Pseudomonadota bacterium]
MHFKHLDLNLLVALDALLTEKSVTRTAKKLHLSQSAISGALARLREYFDDEILVPVGRVMAMTPLSQRLADPLREVLLQIQATIEIKPEFIPMKSNRHFKVMGSDYPTSVLLADTMRVISLEAPHITMDIISPSDRYLELLDRGEIDLMLMPEKYISDDHPSEVLFEDSYTCVVWSGNSLVADSLTLDQFMALGHVSTMFGTNGQTPSFEEWFLKSSGLSRRIEVSTSNFNTLPQLVIGTNRIATMHTRLAKMFANYFPLRLLEPPMQTPILIEKMQWHRFLENDASHIWLRSVLRRLL